MEYVFLSLYFLFLHGKKKLWLISTTLEHILWEIQMDIIFPWSVMEKMSLYMPR